MQKTRTKRTWNHACLTPFCRHVLLFVFPLLLLCSSPSSTATQDGDPSGTVLAQVFVTGPLQDLKLPLFAHLTDGQGREYALVMAAERALHDSRTSYEILERDPKGSEDSWYLLARRRHSGHWHEAPSPLILLLDDGKNILVRANQTQAESLSLKGFEIAWLPRTPLVLRPPLQATTREPLIPTPLVQDMVDMVTETALYQAVGGLSGQWPVSVGGSDYRIFTRHTYSGEPIEMATQFVQETLLGLGLEVQYHDWVSGRNVVATLEGQTRPQEIVLLTAHLDDFPPRRRAPGADDNASGCAAVLAAADILGRYTFERTMRFVFFTGEEQGLLGSDAYANLVYFAGEEIVAVLNMDMIAWDREGEPTLRLHTRPSSNPGYPGDQAIATLFMEVVNAYDLGGVLEPILDPDGAVYSDHASFWWKGYSAILAIEDDESDYSLFYHTRLDRLSTLNMAYFTTFVKACVGTAAHLAVPLPPSSPGP